MKRYNVVVKRLIHGKQLCVVGANSERGARTIALRAAEAGTYTFDDYYTEYAVDTVEDAAQKVTYVCAECGSANVKADSRSVWNQSTQKWEHAVTFDCGHVCEDCNTQVELREVLI